METSTSDPILCMEVGNGTSGTEAKKRKNRWGSPQGDAAPATEGLPSSSTSAQLPAETSEPAKAPARKSRFSAAPAEPMMAPAMSFAMPAPPVMSQEVVQQTIILKLQLQKVNEKLITVVKDALAIEANPNRSPSPPPRYDSSGKRTNTREVRMREALMKERGRLIEEMMKLNPQFQAPVDFVKSKPVRRIFLPKLVNPNYNYIGLIIGPRGNTQKQLEQETGAKISIRGKGSSKEGSKGRKNVDEDEELHVHITAETQESVDKASKLIEDLLRPEDDALNEHKQKQLRELALINGTLREDEYCPVCGEKGHRQFECPHRARSFKAAGVKCSICGDLSHPTRDCPLKQEGPTSEGILDSEYDSFMAELGEAPARGSAVSSGAGGSASGGAGGANGAAAGGASVGAGRSSKGTIFVAPIVELVPQRKAQTIIHVTSMMTGLSAPPVFASSSAMATDITSHSAYGTAVAPSLLTSTALPSGFPSAFPSSLPSVPSLTSLSAAGAGAGAAGSSVSVPVPGVPPASWAGAYSAYPPAAYPSAPAAYPADGYPSAYASVPAGVPAYGNSYHSGISGSGGVPAYNPYAPVPVPVPVPPPAPQQAAVPPPPAHPSAPAPAPAASRNQFHYVYPSNN